MVTDEQVLHDHLDLEMLERPHLWPCGSYVMVKRRNGRQNGPCQRLPWEDPDGTPGHGFIIRCHDWDQNGEVSKLVYSSAEAVLADGWLVD